MNSSTSNHHKFHPPWMLRNPHVQTVLGYVFRGRAFPYPSVKHRITLSDGDQIVMHDSQPPQWQLGDPITLLVHGLGGCHDSGYSRRLGRMLYREGLRVVRMDMRGSGASLPLCRRSYNAGQSEDLRAGIEKAHHWSPESPIVTIGVSLGGNVVLKLGGEAAERPVPGLTSIISVAPPIDLAKCCELISEHRNRFYEKFFVDLLLRQLAVRRQHFPDLPHVQFPKKLTLRQFDELWTAPQHGFRGAMDYYQRSSAISYVPRTRLPTYVLTARDDPVVAVEPFESLQLPSNVEMNVVDYGGHLGFIGPDGRGGYRWAEAHIVNRVIEQLKIVAPQATIFYRIRPKRLTGQ